MIFEFKTKRNTYGRRKYLGIDTDKKVFSRNSTRIIVEGIEIKANDYKAMLKDLADNGFDEVMFLN